VPFVRLVKVELRKLVDTRSGRWLMMIAGAIVAVTLLIMLLVVDSQLQTFWLFVEGSLYTVGIFLAILGVLTVTSEWSQRTALVTFTHEPRRGRIVAAKITATIVAAIISLVLSFALAAVANLLAVGLLDATGDWDVSARTLWVTVLLQILGVLFGVGIGMLILSTPGAVVLYFVVTFLLPTLWGTLGAFWATGWDIGSWVDMSWSAGALMEGPVAAGQPDPMTGETSSGITEASLWARFAVGNGLWVGLPLIFGAFRVLRSEVK